MLFFLAFIALSLKLTFLYIENSKRLKALLSQIMGKLDEKIALSYPFNSAMKDI
jgi:hypothetical protein